MAALDRKITIETSEYRPCKVGYKIGLFHRWGDVRRFNIDTGITSVITVGLVEFEDGSINEVSCSFVQFLDSKSKFEEFAWEGNEDEKDWEKAITHTQEMKKEAELLGPHGIFYVHGCNEYIERYNNGERSKDLYESMMNLH